MKKRVLCFGIIILLLLAIPLTLAEETNLENEEEENNLEESEKETNLEGEEINNLNNELTKTGNQEINQKINEIISKEINLPDKIEDIMKKTLGLSLEKEIKLNFIIMFIVLVIFLFFITHNLVELLPSFDSISAYLGAFVIISLLSLSGILKITTQFLLSLNKRIELISEIDILGLIMGICITLIIYLLISIIMGIIRQSIIRGRAISEGVSIGTQIAKLKSMAEIEELSRRN